MEKLELRNATDMKFDDISSELYREYDFGVNGKVRIDKPLYLNVSKSNGHRILDAEGLSHYIPYTWIALKWQSKNEEPHFVK